LIRSINSFIVCTGKFELTTHEFGVAPALVTGMKSLSTSHLVVKAWIDDDARRRQQDSIAVARRAGRIRHADIAAGAGDVFNVELVPQLLGKLLRDQPSGDVGHAAGRERDDDPDGLARVLLCEGRARNDERRAERDEADYLFHLSSSFSPFGCRDTKTGETWEASPPTPDI
jgi:hypothetical protein